MSECNQLDNVREMLCKTVLREFNIIGGTKVIGPKINEQIVKKFLYAQVTQLFPIRDYYIFMAEFWENNKKEGDCLNLLYYGRLRGKHVRVTQLICPEFELAFGNRRGIYDAKMFNYLGTEPFIIGYANIKKAFGGGEKLFIFPVGMKKWFMVGNWLNNISIIDIKGIIVGNEEGSGKIIGGCSDTRVKFKGHDGLTPLMEWNKHGLYWGLTHERKVFFTNIYNGKYIISDKEIINDADGGEPYHIVKFWKKWKIFLKNPFKIYIFDANIITTTIGNGLKKLA